MEKDKELTAEKLLERVEQMQKEHKEQVEQLQTQLDEVKKAKEQVELKLATMQLSGKTQQKEKVTIDEDIEYKFIY